MDDSNMRALLVGDDPQSFSLVKQMFEKSGCQYHFADSLEAVKILLQSWQFDVVLSTHGIPSYPIQKLVGLFSGSSASLFTSLRAEEGSWWLPVLQSGKECYGPAFTVGEFPRVLDDQRRQISMRDRARQIGGYASSPAISNS
jgi:hypothetical protein